MAARGRIDCRESRVEIRKQLGDDGRDREIDMLVVSGAQIQRVF